MDRGENFDQSEVFVNTDSEAMGSVESFTPDYCAYSRYSEINQIKKLFRATVSFQYRYLSFKFQMVSRFSAFPKRKSNLFLQRLPEGWDTSICRQMLSFLSPAREYTVTSLFSPSSSRLICKTVYLEHPSIFNIK